MNRPELPDVPDLPSLPDMPALPDVVPDFVSGVLDSAAEAVPLLIDVSIALV